MSNCLHLAIPAGDLEVAKTFYCDVLGCKTGNSEAGRWVDIDFWGNELTLHQSQPRNTSKGKRHDVDMGAVQVPHFGIHLPLEQYEKVKEKVEKSIGFLDKPYIRFKGTDYQQETFFVQDPNFNILEIKSMVNSK